MKIFDPNAWLEFGKEFGIGNVFAMFILIFFAFMAWYVLRACFNSKTGFVREFFVQIKNAATAFLEKMTESLERLESRAKDSHDAQVQQQTLTATLYAEHMTAGGKSNVSDLRGAAIHLCDAFEKVGGEIGVDIHAEMSAARSKLTNAIEASDRK